MALPLDTPRLLSYLRATFLLQSEKSNQFVSAFPPDPDPSGIINTILKTKDLARSPPISINDFNDDSRSLAKEAHHKTLKRRSKIRHKSKRKSSSNVRAIEKTSISSVFDSDSAMDDMDGEAPVGEEEIKIKGKPKGRPNIIRFFQKDKDEVSDSDSDGSIRTTKLNATDDESVPRDLDVDSDTTQKISDSNGSPDLNSDSMIDKSSVLATPSDPQKEELKSKSTANALSVKGTRKDSLIQDDETEDYEDSDEYDDEYDYEEEVSSSSDSAFTDIEADSMIDSSLLLDSYDNDTLEFTFDNKKNILENLSHDSKKGRKRSSRQPSFVAATASKTPTAYSATSTKAERSNSTTTLATTGKQPVKKHTVKFDKVDPTSYSHQPLASKLSAMIQTKFKSTNTNPLHYYSFVDSDIASNTVKKVKLNIYVPPETKPTLKELSLNNNVTIADCIGYILLHLTGSDLPSEESSFLNPNHWRLELVDEDGENYGSFGILDRTRLLSSYNNPTDLAICKVTDPAERLKNEKQSPLPLEFKQNVLTYLQQSQGDDSASHDGTKTSKMTITFRIFVAFGENNKQTFMFSTDSQATVKELLYDFCNERNLDASNYRLRVIFQAGKGGKGKSQDELTLADRNLIDASTSGRLLSNNEPVSAIESDLFEIVPAKNLTVNSMTSNGSTENPIFGGGITPNENLSVITPGYGDTHLPIIEKSGSPVSTEQDKNEAVAHLSTKLPKAITKEKLDKSNKLLDDIITGFNSQLPTNLNTIYFKWKVWRKKTTILNKIEKSLIIDGDYIHLAPSDDVVFKRNPSENPFLSSHSQSTSHHLHHYNYASYYNSSIMKTSSFHITQIVKLKQYKESKNPNHFKIVIKKTLQVHGKENVKKKYDLEAVSEKECEEIIAKIRWVMQVYTSDTVNVNNI